MHVIVANSENVQRRIKRYLGHDSIVVYPPIDTESFVWGEPQGYYLSTARLTPLKRVATIVEAFVRMPDRQLVVASGGEDEAALRRVAPRGHSNIRFTGWTDEAQLRSLISGAIATIYIPVDEDFGMSPVESMAAGKPVIGVAEGGLLETIVPGRDGGVLLAARSAARGRHARRGGNERSAGGADAQPHARRVPSCLPASDFRTRCGGLSTANCRRHLGLIPTSPAARGSEVVPCNVLGRALRAERALCSRDGPLREDLRSQSLALRANVGNGFDLPELAAGDGSDRQQVWPGATVLRHEMAVG